MLVTCWILYEYCHGFLRQLQSGGSTKPLSEEEEAKPDQPSTTKPAATNGGAHIVPQEEVEEEEEGDVFHPGQGLPDHVPNRKSSARPKSGKVLRRKNTPALLPKVEKLYAKDKVTHDPILCEEEEEEEEESSKDSTKGAHGGH